jgi:hypothetical protein
MQATTKLTGAPLFGATESSALVGVLNASTILYPFYSGSLCATAN